jgi:hypothetical protein
VIRAGLEARISPDFDVERFEADRRAAWRTLFSAVGLDPRFIGLLKISVDTRLPVEPGNDDCIA